MAKYRVHFTDNYGQCTLECENDQQYDKTMDSLKADPACEDIWTEYWDQEEGWQA